MKTVLLISALICLVQAKVLPTYLQELICPVSHPKFEKCVYKNLEKARSYLLKGIPEINLPPFEPFELPIVSVNRTLNELVSINSVLRNVKVTGMGDVVIEDMKINPAKFSGEVRLSFPKARLTMDYNVKGQLLVIPLQSEGFFDGTFTNSQVFVKGNAKLIEKNGTQYFMVDKMFTKLRIGDGNVKLVAKNPDLQFGADLIANFFNKNPRLVLDAVNPIAVEASNDVFSVISNQILGRIPANELIKQ